jgi:hypothetical protein
MFRTSMRFAFAAVCAAGLMFLLACSSPAAAEDAGLTFFGWSDQHVATSGDAKHLLPAIDAMNALPGTKYPERFGGVVAKPALVFGCGDITEWPTVAAKNAYEGLITKRLKFPAYDIAGNHDEGGEEPSRTVLDWIAARHKSLSYTFDSGGVHFVAVFSKYDESLNSPAQPITKEALKFIREELAKVSRGPPVVLAMHLCLDAITNRDELVAAIGKGNVILVLGGHYHKSTVQKYRGLNFVQLPSPAANGPGQFTVIRITADRLVAVPYDYRGRQWVEQPGAILDAAVRLRQNRVP